jgi:hypothetical protein
MLKLFSLPKVILIPTDIMHFEWQWVYIPNLGAAYPPLVLYTN